MKAYINNIVEHLIENYKARTVVLFMSYSTVRETIPSN